MKKRTFMQMLGMAPVAIAAGPSPVTVAQATNAIPLGAAMGQISQGLNEYGFREDDDSPLASAYKRLHAFKYARSVGAPTEYRYADREYGVETECMKSWSNVTKKRIASERWHAQKDELALEEAIEEVARQTKLALAPKWMRGFLR